MFFTLLIWGFIAKPESWSPKGSMQQPWWISAHFCNNITHFVQHLESKPGTLICGFFNFSLYFEGSATFWLVGLRWNKKLNRPLTSDEMLGCMGMPVTNKMAEWAGLVRPVDLSMLSKHAKAIQPWQCVHVRLLTCGQVTMAGNGMDVPSVGFVLLCVRLASLMNPFLKTCVY